MCVSHRIAVLSFFWPFQCIIANNIMVVVSKILLIADAYTKVLILKFLSQMDDQHMTQPKPKCSPNSYIHIPILFILTTNNKLIRYINRELLLTISRLYNRFHSPLGLCEMNQGQNNP